MISKYDPKAIEYPFSLGYWCGTDEEAKDFAAAMNTDKERLQLAIKALEHVIPFIESMPPECMGVGGDGDNTRWYIRDEWIYRAKEAVQLKNEPKGGE